MGHFYKHAAASGKPVWFYSERGLLSFLFSEILADDLAFALDRATDAAGTTLASVIGKPTEHVVLTEFDLGAQGFGCPDGGVFVAAGPRSYFVFVEGKAGPFSGSFQPPPVKTVDELASPDVVMDDLTRANSFNSSINGQLELRWRFTNALVAARSAGMRLVTECLSPPHEVLMRSDRLYWRLGLRPSTTVEHHWRRVDMRSDLTCLYDLFSRVDEFLLLSVTDDRRAPDFASVRLFDATGTKLDVARRVFHLDMAEIRGRLTRM